MTAKSLLILLAASAIACSNENSTMLGAGGSGGPGGAAGGSPFLKLDAGAGGAGADGGTLKKGEIKMVVRDFKFYDANDPKTNPDFENTPQTDQNGNPTKDYWGPWRDREIVTDTLGDDFKPVYKNASGTTLTTHGKASFDQWFRNVDGTNIVREIPLTLTETSSGTYRYDSKDGGPLSPGGMFFPIDDGTPHATEFGNQDDVLPTKATVPPASHNFSFTVEIHTLFTYQGGETFFFSGDDDVFVYIDGKRVINLGGIHSREEENVSIDSLKGKDGQPLVKGETYPLDFFYAERHVIESNLLITTTLELSTNPNIPIF